MQHLIFLCIIFQAYTYKVNSHSKEIIPAKSDSTDSSEVIIAFGSYYNPSISQKIDIFEKINSAKPDVFIWLGPVLASEDFSATDEELLQLKKKPAYLQLDSKTYITGISDFGKNDQKPKNQLFYFLNEKVQSERRNRNELYKAFWILVNPSNSESKKKYVKVMLLDINKVDESINEISKEQFEWIDDELNEEKEGHVLTIIASSYQILSCDKLYDEHLEIGAKKRILNLFRKSSAPIFLISGTSLYSFGEILKYPCSDMELGYTLYEMTSSGLNVNDFPELKKLNKLSVPSTFNNFSDRTFKPNYGQLRIKYFHKKPEASVIYMELIGEPVQFLVSKSTSIPMNIHRNRKQEQNPSCQEKLYNEEIMYMSIMQHFFKTLLDPEFRVFLIAFFGVTILSWYLCLVYGGVMMNNKKKGLEGYLDEYEKYHNE